MIHSNLRRCALLVLLTLASPLAARSAGAAAGPLVLTGSLAGAAYKIEVPAPWNGTVLLYSQHFVPPGLPDPAVDAPDPLSGAWLLAHGDALAGAAYGTGWAVAPALRGQIALLDLFARRVGPPRRTIAWGQSLGGMVTAGLVQQFPARFSGALVLGGAVATQNGGLDTAFALKTLLAPTATLRLAHIGNPGANLQQAEQTLALAQRTPQGRARIALAAALADIPGWIDPTAAAPAPGDFAAQEQNQFLYEQNYAAPSNFAGRAELEQRAGGNPSWNTGVDYAAVLAHSAERTEVQGLYRQVGLDLAQDLAALRRAPRIAADPRAVAYLSHNIDFTGQIRVPVLTMHTTGDGLAPVAAEQDYARVVAAAGQSAILRQAFVQRAHHCSFTRGEELTGLQALLQRLDTGEWGTGTDPDTLNLAAAALEESDQALARIAPLPGFYTTTLRLAPAFVPFAPGPYLRPYDNRSLR